jgi:type VI protein secretion system component VasF
MSQVDPQAKQKARETSSSQALRMETRGLIFIAVVILVVYLIRYGHLLHRSTP